MPVLPLPPDNTARYWVDYVANGIEHTFQIRYPGGSSAGEPDFAYVAALGSFLTEIAAVMPTDFDVLGARYAPAGTDVTLPASAAPSAGTGLATPQQGEAPAFWTFVGRTVAGRKTKLMIQGISASPASEGGIYSNYRVTSAESEVVADCIARLNLVPLLGIDGQFINWYSYVNVGYSAYWQKRQRGGS